MSLYSPLVGQFMLPNPVIIPIGTSVPDLVTVLQQRGQSRAIVVDNGLPKGIISEKELVAILGAERTTAATSLADIMSTSITLVKKTQSLRDLQTAVLYLAQSHVVVVDTAGFVCGAIYPEQLVAVYAHLLETQAGRLDHALKSQLASLTDENRRLHRQTLEDALLKISNRRAFEKDISALHAKCRRYKRLYSIMIVDIDDFREFNSAHGHMKGDELLISVTQFLQKVTRVADRLFRYGGNQFVLLLPETHIGGVEVLAHRMLEKWQYDNAQLQVAEKQLISLSIGIKSLTEKDLESAEWSTALGQADLALHESKLQGKNRIVCAGQIAPQAKLA